MGGQTLLKSTHVTYAFLGHGEFISTKETWLCFFQMIFDFSHWINLFGDDFSIFFQVSRKQIQGVA